MEKQITWSDFAGAKCDPVGDMLSMAESREDVEYLQRMLLREDAPEETVNRFEQAKSQLPQFGPSPIRPMIHPALNALELEEAVREWIRSGLPDRPRSQAD